MGAGNRIYNWLARRNIGSWLGLKWDPDKDEAYKEERRLMNLATDVRLTPAILESAELALHKGDYAAASRTAHRALWRLEAEDDGRMPGVSELKKRAKHIIARLPSNTPIPPRIQVISATDYVSKVMEVSQLIEKGALKEAHERHQQLTDYEVDSSDEKRIAATLALMAVTVKLGEMSKRSDVA